MSTQASVAAAAAIVLLTCGFTERVVVWIGKSSENDGPDVRLPKLMTLPWVVVSTAIVVGVVVHHQARRDIDSSSAVIVGGFTALMFAAGASSSPPRKRVLASLVVAVDTSIAVWGAARIIAG